MIRNSRGETVTVMIGDHRVDDDIAAKEILRLTELLDAARAEADRLRYDNNSPWIGPRSAKITWGGI